MSDSDVYADDKISIDYYILKYLPGKYQIRVFQKIRGF